MSERAEYYDVIVVGGGPAGATAALYCVRHGLKTLLVDKSRFPRDKICGDAISGKSVRFLRELGLDSELNFVPRVRATGVKFSSPNGRIASIPFSPAKAKRQAYGYVCRREVFDTIFPAGTPLPAGRQPLPLPMNHLPGPRPPGSNFSAWHWG